MKNGSAAIFIDGDNISSALFERAYDKLNASYSISLTRVYGDYSQQAMAKWHELCRSKGFEEIQCANSPKKNSTDLKLIDDIYFNLYENQRVKTYIIVSNDRDYTFVVQRLKSKGKKVIIVGHNNTPSVYKNLADEFVCLTTNKPPKNEFVCLTTNKPPKNEASPNKKPKQEPLTEEKSSNSSDESNEDLEKNSSEEDSLEKPVGKKRKRNRKRKNKEKLNENLETEEKNQGDSSPKDIDKSLLYKDAENVVIETLALMGDKEDVISSYKKKLNKVIEEYSNPDVRLFFLPYGRLVDILEEHFSHLLEIIKVKESQSFFKVFLKAKDVNL